MSINRKIRRNKNNPMVNEYVALSSKNIFSDEREDITTYSYNRNHLKDGQDFVMRFSIYMLHLIIASAANGGNIYKYVDFFENQINNINADNSTMELDYEVENDRITYNGKLAGINLGKLRIGKYFVYFAGPYLFFEDTDTHKKYMFSIETKENTIS